MEEGGRGDPDASQGGNFLPVLDWYHLFLIPLGYQ
jgi:hypothetical protein